ECQRVMIAASKNVVAQVLDAVCSLRLGVEAHDSIAVLAEMAEQEDAPLEMRVLAAYECGREQWRADNIDAAYTRLVFAFLKATDQSLFLRAGCSLYLLTKEHSELKERSSSLTLQVQSNRDLYDWGLHAEGGGLPELARVIVVFQEKVIMENTLEEALVRIFGEVEAVPPDIKEELPIDIPEEAQPDEERSVIADEDLAELIGQAQAVYEEALQRQQEGDWAGYGEKIEELEEILSELGRLLP
ncbi:MAG: hypothetical protein R6U08_05405, partial [Bacillota bacterium]